MTDDKTIEKAELALNILLEHDSEPAVKKIIDLIIDKWRDYN